MKKQWVFPKNPRGGLVRVWIDIGPPATNMIVWGKAIFHKRYLALALGQFCIIFEIGKRK